MGISDDHPHGSWRPAWADPTSAVSVRVLITYEDAETGTAADVVDDWRLLSPLGHRQAGQLVEQLADVPIHRVLSGPALRCRQTVLPLAQDRGLDIEPMAAMAVGADVALIAALLDDPAISHAAICTDPLTRERLLAYLEALGRVLTKVIVTPAGPAVVLTVSSATGATDDGRLASL